MRDYWLTQYILSAIGWGYLIAVLLFVALVLWLVKGKTAKTICLLVVIGLASILPLQGYKEYAKEKNAEAAYRVRLAKAQALFDERCKTAGEKIYKTVENVEGVLLTKVRPQRTNFSDQFVLDDPYGHDVGEIGYIMSFLWDGDDKPLGYSYVDVLQADGSRTRHYLRKDRPRSNDRYADLIETKLNRNTPTFTVDYEDISSSEERKNWIAGGALRVFDTKTNSMVAERIGFIFDTALGNTGGGRGPWGAAISCHSEDRKYGHNARFVMKFLKPISEK